MMARPSDYTEGLCQALTDDLVKLRNMDLDGPAHLLVQRMLDRIEGFDHSFGFDAGSGNMKRTPHHLARPSLSLGACPPRARSTAAVNPLRGSSATLRPFG